MLHQPRRLSCFSSSRWGSNRAAQPQSGGLGQRSRRRSQVAQLLGANLFRRPCQHDSRVHDRGCEPHPHSRRDLSLFSSQYSATPSAIACADRQGPDAGGQRSSPSNFSPPVIDNIISDGEVEFIFMNGTDLDVTNPATVLHHGTLGIGHSMGTG